MLIHKGKNLIGIETSTGYQEMPACNQKELKHTQALTEKIEFLELASLAEFQRCFARNMNFTK